MDPTQTTNTNDSYFLDNLTQKWSLTYKNTKTKISNIQKNIQKKGFLESPDLKLLSTLGMETRTSSLSFISALEDLNSNLLKLEKIEITSTDPRSKTLLFKGLQEILVTENFPKLFAQHSMQTDAAIKTLLDYAKQTPTEASVYAYKYGHQEITQILKPEVTPSSLLEKAMEKGDKKMVITLLQKIPELNTDNHLITKICNWACEKGDIEKVEVIEVLMDGEKDEIKSKIIAFSIVQAIQYGHIDLLQILLQNPSIGQHDPGETSLLGSDLTSSFLADMEKHPEVAKLLIQDPRFTLNSRQITEELFRCQHIDCDLVALIVDKFKEELDSVDQEKLKAELEYLPLLNYINAQEENRKLLVKLLSKDKIKAIENSIVEFNEQLDLLKQLTKSDEKQLASFIEYLFELATITIPGYSRPRVDWDSVPSTLFKYVINEISLDTVKALSLYLTKNNPELSIVDYLPRLKHDDFFALVNWILTDKNATSIKESMEQSLNKENVTFRKCLKVALDHNHYALINWLGGLPNARDFSNCELKTRARAFLRNVDRYRVILQVKQDVIPNEILTEHVGNFLNGPNFFESFFRIEDKATQKNEQIQENEERIGADRKSVV